MKKPELYRMDVAFKYLLKKKNKKKHLSFVYLTWFFTGLLQGSFCYPNEVDITGALLAHETSCS